MRHDLLRNVTITLSATIGDDLFSPLIARALRSYAEAIEGGTAGNQAHEVMMFGRTRLHVRAAYEEVGRAEALGNQLKNYE